MSYRLLQRAWLPYMSVEGRGVDCSRHHPKLR
jgi:hypothetical protein